MNIWKKINKKDSYSAKIPIIFLAVTNDLVTDQRVHRIANTLSEKIGRVTVIGRKLQSNYDFTSRSYKVHLLNLPFRKGIAFYASYNFVLLFYLLRKKINIIVANDLDTLPACFVAAKLKQIPIVYDSHELFSEVPELVCRPVVKKIWLIIEKIFVPRLKYAYTVCQSIADIYNSNYQVNFKVIRNLPIKKNFSFTIQSQNHIKTIIYQGALNLGRGIEKVIKALEFIENVHFYIAGTGDVEMDLKQLAANSLANERIHFLGRLPFEQLHQFTTKAHLGISLEENLGLNYYYALPNKIFDYIQAGIPVLVSDFPEMGRIIKEYNIGIATLESEPEKLAKIISNMLFNEALREIWIKNIQKAAAELNWEKEEKVLIQLYKEIVL